LVSAQFQRLLVQTQKPALSTPVMSMKPLPMAAPQAEQAAAVQLAPAVGGVVGSHDGTGTDSL
jgi:hypothetical protein